MSASLRGQNLEVVPSFYNGATTTTFVVGNQVQLHMRKLHGVNLVIPRPIFTNYIWNSTETNQYQDIRQKSVPDDKEKHAKAEKTCRSSVRQADTV